MNKKRVVVHLVFGAFVTVISLFVYLGIFQVYRNNANDPQLEISLDASKEIPKLIAQGVSVESIIQGRTLEISESVSMFFVVFDKEGKTLASSGKLKGNLPVARKSILEASKKTGQNILTWEPQKDLRFAAVIRPFENDSGYILVARSLKNIENSIKDLMKISFVAWLVLLILSYVLVNFWVKENITLVEQNEVVIVESPKD
jgi:hypothetical protein